MIFEKLTFKSVDVRPVLVPLRRPVVSKVGLFDQWPIILIDLETEEGIVGRSYLEPYLKHVGALHRARHPRSRRGARRASRSGPLEDFQKGLKSLNLVGNEGISMIAVSGLDMAAWDALAKAASMPLAVFLGGSLGPVPAYNSNGLWLTDVAPLGDEARRLVAEGGFKGLKLRLGRERLADDLAAIDAVRAAAGADIKLMVDFNQGLEPRRCAAPLPRARRPGPLLVRGADRLQQSRGLCAARARAARHRSSSARISMGRARCIRRWRWAAATTSCPT